MGEHDFGYHFYQAFRDCPRKWFLSHIIELEPILQATPLLFGKAVHEAIAAYYSSPVPLSEVPEWARNQHYLYDHRDLFKTNEEYEEALTRLGPAVVAWVNQCYGKDLAFSTKASSLSEVRLEANTGLTRGTLDHVFDSGTESWLRELKTTSYSLSEMMKSVIRDDQITMYFYLLIVNGYNPQGGVCDVVYSKGSSAKADRVEIYRSLDEINEYIVGLEETIHLMGQMLERFRDITGNPEIFWRNTHSCDRCSGCSICEGRTSLLSDLMQRRSFLDAFTMSNLPLSDNYLLSDKYIGQMQDIRLERV